MRRDVKVLNTILEYCDNIIEDVNYFGNDEETFMENPQYQRSTAFSIFQIGEMTKRLSPELRTNYPDMDWRGMCGIRDVIVHGYEHIRLESIWESIQNDIPVIKSRCKEIITELESQADDDDAQ